jgi:hypothetical protein
MGAASSIASDAELLRSIRLIPFQDFKALGQLPRYPDNRDLTITLDRLDEETYNTSLIVFISHCWLRGWDGAEGWDGRPHPDNAEGGKFALCVEGIEKVLKIMAPGMTNCFLWLDFGCIDQDGDPAGELRQLDKIVQVCDCVLTPIFDKDPGGWDFPKVIRNYYDDYRSPSWSGQSPVAYLSRGWCRVEMFFAANIPLLPDPAQRRERFANALAFHRAAGRRPHILYGSKERAGGQGAPKVLPPLRNSFFAQFHPEQGRLTKAADREAIRRLVEELRPFMTPVAEGYDGETVQGRPHGRGRYVYANGDEFVGHFLDGKQSGHGRFVFACGHIYEGDWRLGKRHGPGRFLYANGNCYAGDFQDNKRHGRGRYQHASGDVYEGDWRADCMHGRGRYLYAASGDEYEGEFRQDLKHGRGRLALASGEVYEGEWRDNKICGRGLFLYADGSRFEGEFRDGRRHGRGKFTRPDGSAEEADWADGVKCTAAAPAAKKKTKKKP